MSFKRLFDTEGVEINDRDLEVSGEIPSWLKGIYLKNGPGLFSVGDSKCEHWFDGLAMLNRIEFQDGKVSHTSKYLNSTVYEEAQKNNKITYSLFSFVPKMGLIQMIKEIIYGRSRGNNAAVNILKAKNKYFAMTESIGLVEFDPNSLETQNVHIFEDDIQGKITTAHPHVESDEYINFDIVPGKVNKYHYYKVNTKTLERQLIGIIETQYLSYVHDFSVTENYIIHIECPSVVFPISLLLRFGFLSYSRCYKWKPEFGTKFTVMDRKTGEIVCVAKSRAILSLHHVNAYEEGNNVVVDLVAFDDDSVIQGLYIDALVKPDTRIISKDARVIRFSVDVDKEEVNERVISKSYLELPTINKGMRGVENYKFIYGVGVNPAMSHQFDNAITKVSIDDGSELTWAEKDSYPGEPLFIPHPNARHEDDGVLISIVSNPVENHSYILILKAKCLSEISRIRLHHMIPLGFHGIFVPKKS